MRVEGRFEVTGHDELTGRGAFIVGHIRSGVIRPGMYVDTLSDSLRIAGVECLDNTRERKYLHALVFAERPSLDVVRAAFPVGTVVEIRAESAPSDPTDAES